MNSRRIDSRPTDHTQISQVLCEVWFENKPTDDLLSVQKTSEQLQMHTHSAFKASGHSDTVFVNDSPSNQIWLVATSVPLSEVQVERFLFHILEETLHVGQPSADTDRGGVKC